MIRRATAEERAWAREYLGNRLTIARLRVRFAVLSVAVFLMRWIVVPILEPLVSAGAWCARKLITGGRR